MPVPPLILILEISLVKDRKSHTALCIAKVDTITVEFRKFWEMCICFGFSDLVIVLLLPFGEWGLTLPNQPVWERDPWSRQALRAPLKQNPPAPFSHHWLFMPVPVFLPLGTPYWNATLWLTHLNLCELCFPLSSTQHYKFSFMKCRYILSKRSSLKRWRCSPWGDVGKGSFAEMNN